MKKESWVVVFPRDRRHTALMAEVYLTGYKWLGKASWRRTCPETEKEVAGCGAPSKGNGTGKCLR